MWETWPHPHYDGVDKGEMPSHLLPVAVRRAGPEVLRVGALSLSLTRKSDPCTSLRQHSQDGPASVGEDDADLRV